MPTLLKLSALVLCLSGGAAFATDVINQDNREYTVKVQGEGKLSISSHKVRAGGSLYGLCGYSFCTFEIPGQKVSADKNARITIRNGKFTR